MPRILIVDDKEENLYYLQALLDGHGYTVDTARHGAEALAKARQLLPELVISDLLMPVMDGYTLLRHWKADSRLAGIPFIVYTATYTEPEDERLALDFGADAFVLKPCEPRDFMARIREVEEKSHGAASTPQQSPAGDENAVLKHYSETLIRKLEEKTLQLEEANRILKQELAERRAMEAELQLKHTILQTQQETSLDAIMMAGEHGEVLTFNQKFIELWGLPPQIANTNVDALVLPYVAGQTENPEAFVARVKHLYAHRDEHGRDELRLKDGRTVDRYSAPIVGSDGKYYGRIWYFRNITERKETEARIVYLNRVHAMLSGINTLIVRVRSRDELFHGACRVATEAGGFRMAMICMIDPDTQKVAPVASVGKDAALLADVRNILSSTQRAPTTMVACAIREKRTIVANDSKHDPRVLFGPEYSEAGVNSMAVLPLIVAGKAIGALALYARERDFFHDEELKLVAELAGDISFAIDHLEKQERLNYLAYYDSLTGLANRKLLLERATQLMRVADHGKYKLGLLLINLDRFKNINDSLGRQAGDTLLKQVTGWLTCAAGDASTLARVGSDHFVMLLPKVTMDTDAAHLIEKLNTSLLEHTFRLGESEFRISAKMGIALFPDDGSDAETLLGNAEAALKSAKKSGDLYLFHTKKMTEAVAGKLSLENELRRAIDNEEFVLHYQPKINLSSGRLTGAEALIRWNDPRSGLAQPGQFIPVLEETGLIYNVGRWALGQALQDYLRWRAAGLMSMRIAVNVSPLQLRNPGFVAEIESKIGIDAHAAEGLELEITESMVIEDIARSISSLQAIRKLGVAIAIDDFGTGFSSLSYLSKLPVDTLKIDRSFVIDMTQKREGLALVSTIINLAHSLNLKVVAEGVETEEQSRLLRLVHCDEMQGFLFSQALPAEAFEAKFLRPN